jgi:hypothetical protein
VVCGERQYAVHAVVVQELPSMSANLPARSEASMHAVMASLTVIIGNAQLIERRLDRGDPVPPDRIIAAMATIQQAGYKAVHELRERRLEKPDQDEPER